MARTWMTESSQQSFLAGLTASETANSSRFALSVPGMSWAWKPAAPSSCQVAPLSKER